MLFDLVERQKYITQGLMMSGKNAQFSDFINRK